MRWRRPIGGAGLTETAGAVAAGGLWIGLVSGGLHQCHLFVYDAFTL